MKLKLRGKHPAIIGRIETIGLPEAGIEEIEAKVDTGAFTSSIHASFAEIVNRNGKMVLKALLLEPHFIAVSGDVLFFEHFKTTEVKSSNGSTEQRYVITTAVQIFNQTIETEFTLTDRADMKYPVLLGRKFLSGRFVVDVSRKNRSRKWQKRQAKKQRESGSRPDETT